MIWFIFLGLYAVTTTAAIVVLHKRRSGLSRLHSELIELSKSSSAPRERLQVLAHIARIQHQATPWYERSLSTVGVIAFFSMLIATGVQTVRSAYEGASVERLREEVRTLESHRSTAETAMAEVTQAIVAAYRDTGRLERSHEQILRQRLLLLDSTKNLSSAAAVEAYEVAFVIGDFDEAVTTLERNLHKLEVTRSGDLVSMAEYYYLVGANNSAKELVRRLRDELSAFPIAVRLRTATLGAVLYPDQDQPVIELAALQRVSLAEAKHRIERQSRRLREASERVKLSRRNLPSPHPAPSGR